MTCLECEEYNHEKKYCPKFCYVIRDVLNESIPVEWIESQSDKDKWAELVKRWVEREEE